jgi:hypothetical protein
MAGDEVSSANIEGGADAGSERLDRARRRPWLGIICAALLVMAGTAFWVHAEDPFNPYRDGTTHAATLVHDPVCTAQWGVSVDHDRYTWTAYEVPAGWDPGPVDGQVHILHQRPPAMSAGSNVTAVFEARGTTIELVGGREPYFSDLTCAVR